MTYRASADELLEDVPRFITIDETAELLRCSRRQVNRLIATRRLQALKFGSGKGHKVLVPRSSLADFVSILLAQ